MVQSQKSTLVLRDSECNPQEMLYSLRPTHEHHDKEYEKTFSLKRKRVRFSAVLEVAELEPWRDYSDAERHSLWYNSEDYRKFKLACKKTLELMTNTGKVFGGDCEYLCSRGLEDMTLHMMLGLKIRRRKLMKEIRNLWECGDHGYIAELCREYSSPCALQAQLRGMRDESEAFVFQNIKRASTCGIASLPHVEILRGSIHAFDFGNKIKIPLTS